ncbi:hypothetical protein D3Z51_12895 [Clostridiaceae bacterium]|nr:hypothetical protein [Clostridiaceae bacterium]RKI12037.1 hypothetical protein D7V81_12650 [bacterium 1XD21-70]
MNFKERCISLLDEGRMFEDSGHRTRFKELLDCYGDYPFFSGGLCKCMYLSAWDEVHFAVMLEVLTEMALGKERDTREMRMQGEILAGECAGGEYYVFRLSNAFLDGKEFLLEEDARMEPEYEYIIRRALQAGALIERALCQAGSP